MKIYTSCNYSRTDNDGYDDNDNIGVVAYMVCQSELSFFWFILVVVNVFVVCLLC